MRGLDTPAEIAGYSTGFFITLLQLKINKASCKIYYLI